MCVGFQIEKKGFFLSWNSTNFRRCHLQTENLKKLIFVNKNWPNDLRIGCKSPSNFIKFLEMDIDLKEEF
jgi:hypothetical protein